MKKTIYFGPIFFLLLLIINIVFKILPKETNKTLSVLLVVFCVILFFNFLKSKKRG
jgi:hypothetical protein